MKKDKIKIGNIEVDDNTNGALKLFEIYRKKECNPDRIKKLEHDISQFISVDDKIKYCKNLYNEYLLYLDWETLAVSGMTIAKSIFPKDIKLFFDREIQIKIDSLEAEKLTKKIKKRVVTDPAFALFAQIVNFSEVLVLGENEGHECYCERVKNYFKIPDVNPNKSRQDFNRSEPDLKESDKNYKIIIKSILPTLTGADKEKIQKYIDSKRIKVYG